MEPLDHIKRNRNLNTKLLVTIPLDQRIGLAEMSQATDLSQQELIRRAIGSMLADFVASDKKLPSPIPETATKAKPRTQVPSGTSAAPVPSHADDVRPPQPSSDHVWVERGTGGYWRAKGIKKK